MKSNFIKILLLLLMSVSGSCLWAQKRICDLEAVCISPTDTVRNGGSLPLRYGRKNLGPDVMMNTDTTFVQLYKIVDGKKEFVYEGAFGEFGVGTDTVNIGASTIYRARNSFIDFIYSDRTEPFVVDFCVQLDSWKRNSNGDTIRFSYYDSIAENNTCCKQVVVMPRPTTSSLTTELNQDGLLLYPNPAKDRLHIKIDRNWGQKMLSVTVRDVRGMICLERNYPQQGTGGESIALDVQHLPRGMYALSIQSDARVTTKKFSVIK